MREARKELEGSLAPRLEQREKAVDQLEGRGGRRRSRWRSRWTIQVGRLPRR